jgi:phosphoribosylformylglycinamidine synthase
LDFVTEKALHDAVRSLARAGLLQSAHDCSEGGLAVALAESCISAATLIGASVVITAKARADVVLFNEAQSRAVISVRRENEAAVLACLASSGVAFAKIGSVTKNPVLRIEAAGGMWQWDCAALREVYENAIPNLMR